MSASIPPFNNPLNPQNPTAFFVLSTFCLCSVYVLCMFQYVPSVFSRLRSGYLLSKFHLHMFRLPSAYVEFMCPLSSVYVWSMFRLCSGYVAVMFHLYSGYFLSMFPLCLCSVYFLSDIPGISFIIL